MAAAVFKVVCVVVAFMVVVAPYAAEGAMTCGTVRSKMIPCFSYLAVGGDPAPDCCTNFKDLFRMSKLATVRDRRAVCSCLKNEAKAMTDTQIARAAALPGKCHVSIPYKIDPRTDCAKIK